VLPVQGAGSSPTHAPPRCLTRPAAAAAWPEQDEEVERLERSSRPGGWRGLSRGEVMGAMYGRLDPSPARECVCVCCEARGMAAVCGG
jgi:hypothetical protein